MRETNVNEFCARYRGKLRELKSSIQNTIQMNEHLDIVMTSKESARLVQLFNTFKQTRIKTVNIKIENKCMYISKDNFEYVIYINEAIEKQTENQSKERVMSKKVESKRSGLKLAMKVKDLKEFLNDIPDATKLRVDYPLMDGMCEDQLSNLEYDPKTKTLVLNPLDTCIVHNYDKKEEYKNDVKGKTMLFAFSDEHKKITNEYHGRRM